MMKLIQVALVAVTAITMAAGSSPAAVSARQDASFDHTHAGLTAIYDTALSGGLIDYAGLRAKPKSLDVYLAQLAATTPAQHAKWSRDQRFAFWINAYNAYTIQLVRDKGPVKSIKDLGGFFSSPWEKKFIPMPAFDPDKKSKKLTLDEIEHKLIRPIFNDARVHAAINCASMGCPPLRATAFSAEGLSEQLQSQVGVWLTDTSRNQVAPAGGKLRVSKIFDWFEKDFGKNDEAVVQWIASHVGNESVSKALRAAAKDLKVRYLDYDWKVNAQSGKR